MTLEEKSCAKIFGGFQKVFAHTSYECCCLMNFAIYLPPKSVSQKCPVVYWLSGLTCTEQNVITKSGIQQAASNLNLIIVCPDTSPRGENIPDEANSYDLGMGAGFYIDATQEPWNKNYRMYSYITKELPDLIKNNFPVLPEKQGIMGHSMGGHGALIAALKNPNQYLSVSAFAPICNPSECPWGLKAFSTYLGTDDKNAWKQYDATELIKSGHKPPSTILVSQGDSDNFLHQKQLLPENFRVACDNSHTHLDLRMEEGYDHSYFFISTFIEFHLKFHANLLSSDGSGE